MLCNAPLPEISLARLRGVTETMLITLAARVLAPEQEPDLGFRDRTAEAIAARLGFDPARFAADRKSMRGTILRARWFDRVIEAWLMRYPATLCLSFGSGLDMRQNRLNNIDAALWYDIELPETLTLREHVRTPGMIGTGLASDELGAGSWLGALPHSQGQPILFFAEGVLMYLPPEIVWRLLARLRDFAAARKAPLGIVFDYVSPFVSRHAHSNSSVRQTGARFDWSLRQLHEVSSRVPGLVLREDYDLARDISWGTSCASRLHALLTRGSRLCGAALFEAGADTV